MFPGTWSAWTFDLRHAHSSRYFLQRTEQSIPHAEKHFRDGWASWHTCLKHIYGQQTPCRCWKKCAFQLTSQAAHSSTRCRPRRESEHAAREKPRSHKRSLKPRHARRHACRARKAHSRTCGVAAASSASCSSAASPNTSPRTARGMQLRGPSTRWASSCNTCTARI